MLTLPLCGRGFDGDVGTHHHHHDGDRAECCRTKTEDGGGHQIRATFRRARALCGSLKQEENRFLMRVRGIVSLSDSLTGSAEDLPFTQNLSRL